MSDALPPCAPSLHRALLPHEALPVLIEALTEGRELLGPSVRDGAIVWDTLHDASALPLGVGDEQAPGHYRLRSRGDARAFGYAVGPRSLKETLFPPRELLYRDERRADGKLGFSPVMPEPRPLAVLGARACELAAIDIQDRVFLHGSAREPRYAARREALALVMAVQCTAPAATCFCGDAGVGPRVGVDADVDIVCTETDAGLLLEARSDAGARLLASLPTRAPTDAERATAEAELSAAEDATRGRLDFAGLEGRVLGALDHPRWDEVAARCLSCGNCTSVCPTCFCSHAEESGPIADALQGEHERARRWDSCFSREHGAMHGANPRPTIKDRYRQWLSHKLGSWVSQLGTSGCVGCGRCTTWCPVGIDLVTEARALAEGALAEGVLAEGALAEGALAEGALAEGALAEGALADVASALPPGAVVAPRAAPLGDDLVPRATAVVAVTSEHADVTTLHVRWATQTPAPGQFLELSLPGVGEAPISVSGVRRRGVLTELELTIRAVGATTRALCALQPGHELGARGPFGRPWPLHELRDHPVVVVAGGLGIAPLRGAIRAMVEAPERFPDLRLFLGARTPQDLLYQREIGTWLESGRVQLAVTVDHADPGWRGHVGVVTRLLRRGAVPAGARALICGPEVMMRFTSDALRKAGIDDTSQWLTLERHMSCAVGFCGRCQLGPHLVCRDGPVFRRDEVAPFFGREGF